ncbi:Heparinase II/III-like protein [Roseovarius lutimaris]|uniref:Heparinase II/III-like protein n=1 Tax=Roseovarius lutimaris TaxID=1005928 RepID=A0A1I5GMY5_9RHOB|nr:heparinase II/III family protein [Roseovarius lutimaris]SFO37424.1 Heparinase II/III-like protein [Roseovarius lutimaris]
MPETKNEATVARQNAPPCLADRKLVSFSKFNATESDNANMLSGEHLSGDGTHTASEDHITSAFSGKTGSYQLRLALPEPETANGVGAHIRLRGWESIEYVGIGYTWDNTFQHVKVVNPVWDHWFDFLVGHHDLAWGWRNNWESPEDRPIKDIRLYIKGNPGTEAFLDVSEMLLWQEDVDGMEDLLGPDRRLSSRVLHAVRDYNKKCFLSYKEQAQGFLETGRCPLINGTMLDWPASAPLPLDLEKTGTYQFSWHAQHAATMLMLYAHETGDIPSLFSAHSLISHWLEQSFFKPDANIKYAWYDHGTAERCLAFVQMYDIGQQNGFDHRFMAQLRLAIFRHAQLLASEVFYAGHQRIRYHNHAWFQDLALLAVCLAFPSWPCAETWVKTALWRLEDQFAVLIRRDNGYSVFVENSIGYHQGVQRIVEFAGVLTTLSDRETEIPEIAQELKAFSDFFRYPDARRTLSQGDTFRLPNLDEPNPRGQMPYGTPEVTVLPETGYAIVKSDHAEHPFMLTMLATSLSRTHKHEDNLSFTLYFDGLEWLIDPSFHSHEYDAPIPAYLRSAAAHNCVFLPDTPYSIDPGLTRLEGRRDGNTCQLSGTHEGYEGMTLSRRLTCALDRLEISGSDILSEPCEGAQLRFHCGEHVSAEIEEGRVLLTHPGSDFILVLEVADASVERVRGGDEPPRMGGLVGHGFMEHGAIDTLIFDVAGRSQVDWRVYAKET